MSELELVAAGRAFLQKQNAHKKAVLDALGTGTSFRANDDFKTAWTNMDTLSKQYVDHPIAIAFRDWQEKVGLGAHYTLNPDGTPEPVSKAASDKKVKAWEEAWKVFVSSCSLGSV